MENQAPQRYTSLHPDEINLAVNGMHPSRSANRARPRCFREQRLVKLLVLLLLVLVLATLVLAIYTFIKLHHHITTTVIPVITKTNKTSECDHIYTAVCHKWKQENPIPEGWPSWDIFSQLINQNNVKLSKIFEKANNSKLESQAEEKAKKFYFTCMDVNGTIEQLGKQPMFDMIDKLGGWNISSTKTKKFHSSKFTSKELQETIQTMKNTTGVDSFFTTRVGIDDIYTKNNSNYILTLFPLESPRGYPKGYLHYMTEIGMLLGADEDSVRQQMQLVYSFYNTLLNSISKKPVKKAMSIAQLDKFAPFIKWKEYFRETVPATIKTLESDDVVVLSDLYFFRNLSKILNYYLKNGHEHKIVLKNFLVWRAVETMTEYLPKDFQVRRREQLRKNGEISLGRTLEYCVHITNYYFSFATAAAFARKMFDNSSKKLVRLMFDDLKQAFNKKLDDLPYLDQHHKEILKNKSDTMSLLIETLPPSSTGWRIEAKSLKHVPEKFKSFPDFILNTAELDKYYSSVNVHENDLFKNVQEVQVHEYQQQFALLGQNAKKARWPFHLYFTPLDVNAIYRKETNGIVVPMGILQLLDLQPRQHMPSHFGNLGFLLAHEFMHAFVNKELSYDENGWPKQIQEMFQEIHGCVAKNYCNCTSPEHCNTLSEDMADLSGVKLAYSAFLDWQAKQQEFIGNKWDFFFTYMQLWCENGSSYHDHKHSRYEIRATKPLSYIPEFVKEFSCKPESSNECRVF